MADGREHARTSAQELVERLLAEQRAKAAARRARERGGEWGGDDSPVHAGERDHGEAVHSSDRVYEDEPIIKTGAQFVRERQQREECDARSKAAYVRQASSREDASWRELMAYGMVRHVEEARTAHVPEWRQPAREASLADFSLEDESGRSFGMGAEPSEPVELPPLLQELRVLEREDTAFLKSRDWLFVRQAKLAADYEDDFAYEGTFQHYFPTYQAMDDRQLRGYFAWRTKARQGKLERTSLSFVFVRLYELLNGVGAPAPEAGFEALRSFVDAYRALDSRIDRYARMWLHDYVIYHGLDRSLLEEMGETVGSQAGAECSLDEALAVLAATECDGAQDRQALGGENAASDVLSDERLFAALCALSSYHLDAARFYRDEPELTRRAACEVWRALGAYYRKHRKRTLFESLFGRRFEVPYPLFRSAVFYGETRHADAEYIVNPTRRFLCRNGRWSEDAYHETKGSSKDLGRVMKALDRTLRKACGSRHQLKAERVPKYAQDIIDGVVERLLEERRQAEERARAVRVEIDFSKLQGIRAAAASTRESLLIDEERADAGEAVGLAEGAGLAGGATLEENARLVEKVGEASGADGPCPMSAPDEAHVQHTMLTPDETQATIPADANAAGLTADEVAYLRCLADGAPTEERAAVLKRSGIMESLMVDAVNEKLYDMLGDIAVEDAGEGPTIIEDYAENVKGIAGL